jgi:membrane-associated phospholipid phosphatase
VPSSTELDHRTSPQFRPHAVCDNVSARNRVRWMLLLPPLVLVALGFAALPFDLQVTRWFLDGNCPRLVAKWLSMTEAFAYGLGVAAILLTILLLDRSRWRTVVRLSVASFGAGLLANVVKLLVARSRPHSFVFDGHVFDTFLGWFPFGDGGSAFQGCPSAHMATATGLAVGLIAVFPQARWWWIFFALSAGLQRVAVADHFVSDVLWGAAVGTFVAGGLLHGGLLAPWFDRWERSARSKNAL